MSTEEVETDVEDSTDDDTESVIVEELIEVEYTDPAELRCGITLQTDSEP